MTFTKTTLAGVFIVDIIPIGDERGFFARMFCKREFELSGLCTDFVQQNVSYNAKSGTVRGLHFQLQPYAEVKIVQCISGSIFDVAVDMRKDSKTYLKWFGCVLSVSNNSMLYIPKGFAHGYQTLEDNSTVLYMVSEYYAPEYESSVRYDSPAIGIDWPIKEDIIISHKDQNATCLDNEWRS